MLRVSPHSVEHYFCAQHSIMAKKGPSGSSRGRGHGSGHRGRRGGRGGGVGHRKYDFGGGQYDDARPESAVDEPQDEHEGGESKEETPASEHGHIYHYEHR